MDNEEKFALIAKNTEEILTEQSLKALVAKKTSPVIYCGYEISGPVHLGHLVTITKLMDFQKAGFKVKILLADVHTKLNKKTPEIEAWKKTIKAIGLKAEIVLGSDFQFSKEYQFDILKLAQKITITRGVRSMQELTRDIKNAVISQIIYPLMQIIDVKYLKADVSLGGTDQRKIYVLGKEEAKTTGHDFVSVHTPLITSLKGPGEKMSSSIPGSNISVTASKEEIEKITAKAYCPEKKAEGNPILQITKLIIFPRLKKIKLSRPEKFGGSLEYNSYEKLESDFKEGKLHPADLKQGVADSLEKIIAPIRNNLKV